jgi:hypothetical protein
MYAGTGRVLADLLHQHFVRVLCAVVAGQHSHYSYTRRYLVSWLWESMHRSR